MECSKKVAVVLVVGILLAACYADTPEERRARLHLPPPGFRGDAL